MLPALAVLSAGIGLAHPGIGIVMDRQGNVYYTDLKQVWKILPDGRKLVAVPHVHTHELCLDAEGRLYGEHLWYEGEASDRWGHRVWRLSPDGSLTDVIKAREGFLKDYSFVRDRLGTMYWVERESHSVFRKRLPSGTVLPLADCPDCRDVRWMTVTPGGTVYFIDDGRLREIAPDGTIRTRARNLQESRITYPLVNPPHRLMGLWTDPAGDIFIAVYGAGTVKRVTPAGKVEVVARSPWPWSPTGGFIAPNGDLWLLEYSLTDAVRVRRIDRRGRETVY